MTTAMKGGISQGVAGWTTVGKRLFRKWVPQWETFSSTKMTKETSVVYIFISNFPGFVKAKELFNIFSDIGEVLEVSIAPRRNKWGKRFGFARFIEVEDAHLLVVKLDNVVIGETKIHANTPRYERKVLVADVRNFIEGESSSGFHRRLEVEMKRPYRVSAGSWKDCRSFIDVVAKRIPEATFRNQEEKKISLEFNLNMVRERLSKAWVGILWFPSSTFGIQQCIERAGFFALKVISLGANRCLLEGLEEGVLEEFLKGGASWWEEWFLDIEKWKDGDVDSTTAVWIDVFKIPILAWNAEFFVLLANLLGSLVCIDKNT